MGQEEVTQWIWREDHHEAERSTRNVTVLGSALILNGGLRRTHEALGMRSQAKEQWFSNRIALSLEPENSHASFLGASSPSLRAAQSPTLRVGFPVSEAPADDGIFDLQLDTFRQAF